MDLPKSVRIGPHVYTIRELANPVKKRGHTQYGQFVPSEQAIEILPDVPTRQLAAEIVLHEILHGVAWLMDLELSDRLEEQVVHAMAIGLAMVIRDNPELMKYLKEALE